MITIDGTPVDRLVSVYKLRALRAKSPLVEDAYRTVAVEIQHAIEEGRQDAILREQRENAAALALAAAASASVSDVVRLPPGGIALDEIEKQAILAALEMEHWVQQRAAQLLRISPRVINYKIQLHGIWRPGGTEAAVS